MKKWIIVAAVLTLWSSLAAQGRIIIPDRPEWRQIPPVRLQSIRGDIRIRQEVATVNTVQTFYNPSRLRLEGDYLFAIPGEAEVHNFALYMGGKKVRGEVMDAKKARFIYEDIVRRLRDPALLEYSGNGLFKARIFPIEPDSKRKIELAYSQLLEADRGTFRLVFPIRQCGEGSIASFHLNIDLQTGGELGTVYSPSHRIAVTRSAPNRASISVEATNLEGDQDLVLYYSLSRQPVDAAILTYRPSANKDGYFMLLVSPTLSVPETEPVPQDFIFVVDASGSMQGEKMHQALEALRFCVNSMVSEDRFEIIRFSSSLESFSNGLERAEPLRVQEAQRFIDRLSASGGTNIDAALRRALQLKSRPDDRPTSLVFLTDGLPTEGETDVTRILQNVSAMDHGSMRIFSFGVGYDVNTFLLDKLSKDSHGVANYVKPGENLERTVSSFFTRISSPVLINPHLDFGDLEVSEIYPGQIPDIFRGQRVSLIGRYRTAGEAKIRLSGTMGGRQRHFDYSVNLAQTRTENDFIAKLWANRKVAHLMDQIRFNGENPELVASVRELGEEYGIVTPYTSYLVREQEKELVALENDIIRGSAGSAGRRIQSAKKARESRAAMDEEAVGGDGFLGALAAPAKPAAEASGRGAVLSSRIQQKVAASEQTMNILLTVRRVNEKTFRLRDGVWVQQGLSADQAAKTIRFLSDDYFLLSRADEQVRHILALGEEVLFSWQGKIYRILNR